MVSSLFRHPSAFLPLAMSLIAITMVLVHFAIFGIVHETDEGTAAHIFQLLMVAQLPLVAFFAVKWVPRAPKQAAQVLAFQAGAALGAIGSVIFFT